MNNSLVENGIGLLLVSSQDTTINLNTFCDNRDEDIKVVGGSGNFGDDNSCDFPDGWNDVGETGCTSLCSITALSLEITFSKSQLNPAYCLEHLMLS